MEVSEISWRDNAITCSNSPGIWISLSVIELFLALCLVVPALNKGVEIAAPIAAFVIALEMLTYCGIHFFSGAKDFGPVGYWVVVALICTFIAYGRFVLRPF